MATVIKCDGIAAPGSGTMLTVGASVGEVLLAAYRDLVPAESRLGEALSQRGLRLGATVADQWPVLHDHLQLFGRGLSPAGMLVLAGAPDAGSRATGIPFTGPVEARRALGLDAAGAAASPSGAAFWRAVDAARGPRAADAPIESFFGTVHLAHALPFDAPPCPEATEAGLAHVRRLLGALRPQAVVTVGADPLRVLGRAIGDGNAQDLAATGEDAWQARWPPGSPLRAYPWAQPQGGPPFRFRLVPLPGLDGPRAAQAYAALVPVLAHAWT